MSYEPKITKAAKAFHQKLFLGCDSNLAKTDPELIERFDNFAFDEVVNAPGNGGGDLDDHTRAMAWIATLLGCQGIDEFEKMAPAALNMGLTPIELKEIVYQSVDYLGIGRVYPFLLLTNRVLEEQGIDLPLPLQSTTEPTEESRLIAGRQAQVDIFGESMADFTNSGPEYRRHINKWLVDNCFGDFYTRKGLDYRDRELVTFCLLAAQGGCEPQLISHAAANMRIGNDFNFLVKVVSQCLPFIGYPRSLNALSCVEKAAGKSGA